ncbi:exo-alpha-sialidase [Polystyrenella longa]|nr:exo-alpha-sialidase [Polystyrenella longa]
MLTPSLMTRVSLGLAFMFFALDVRGEDATFQPLDYEIETQKLLEHDDGHFLWFHPRLAPLPGMGRDGKIAAIMTIQKHLHRSDFYSGLSYMTTYDGGKVWSGTIRPEELSWVSDGDVNVSACDMTPGWHAPSETVLAVGAEVRYSADGDQLSDIKRAHQTSYAVYDPKARSWSTLRRVNMPEDDKFDYARSACAQWLTLPDGTVLLPFYCGETDKQPFNVMVVRFRFDGKDLEYIEHGNEMKLDVVRGLVEPSITFFQNKFYLTLRNDKKGYVTTSEDGLQYEPIKTWTFDDGTELGSYNTQQHWATHQDGLFLCYTRSGADNDHIFRHRAPLFIAQVNPETLQVVRSTERVLVPENGATLGNFGISEMNSAETWVTVSEGIFSKEAKESAATGATWLTRIKWKTPNSLAPKP